MQGILSNDGTGLNPTSDIVAAAIEESEAEAESYLAKRYSLPLKSTDGVVPPKVKAVMITMAKYNLYARRNATSSEVKEAYDSAVNWLLAVSRGDADVPILNEAGEIESLDEVNIGVSDEQKTAFNGFQ